MYRLTQKQRLCSRICKTTRDLPSEDAPPELPGCTGTLIWKYRASSPAPDSDAISPLASLGAHKLIRCVMAEAVAREPVDLDKGSVDALRPNSAANYEKTCG